jgi:hypothetical protein
MRLALPVTSLLGLAWMAWAPRAASAEPVERRLHVGDAVASSFLWNDWNRFQENYHPLYIGDDDPRTAWVEGVEGNGEKQWIRLSVTPLEGATRLRLRLRAGYHKSKSLFSANARPREVVVKLLPSGVSRPVTLADDGEGWQEVSVDQPAGKLDGVELTVVSAYPGTRYTDLCISDAQIFVTAETRENPAFEKTRRDALLVWKKERNEAARLFKQSSAKDLPVLPSYRFETHETAGNDAELWEKCGQDQRCWTEGALAHAGDLEKTNGAALAVAREVLQGKGVGLGRVAPVDKRAFPTVDGLYVPELWAHLEHDFGNRGLEMPLVDTLSALRSGELGALESQTGPTVDQALSGKAPGCKSSKARTHVWLRRERSEAGPEVVRALLSVRCGRIEVRDGAEDVAALQIAVYDAEGRLELTAGPGYVNAFRWSDTGVISGGRGVYPDGRTAELRQPDLAKNP